jgi:MarR family transcriptional regulator, negative regulator of the multidrug operon emrRAB
MSQADDARAANVLGALGLALADRLEEAVAAPFGRSGAEALVTLHERDAGIAIDGLARIVGLTHSGTVRLVDRLAGDGVVERRRGRDQRTAALFLTPQGRRAARRLLRERELAMRRALALLTAGEQDALVEIGAKLLAGLADVPEAARRLCRLCAVGACGRERGACPVEASRDDPGV